jgi:hypothetical protein
MRLSRRFLIGAGAGLALFLALTLIAAHLSSDCGIAAVLGALRLMPSYCSDDIIRVGFPLVVWEEGGFAYHTSISTGALAVDLALAAASGLLGGWLFQRRGGRAAAR